MLPVGRRAAALVPAAALLLAALLAPPLAEAQFTLGITRQMNEGDTVGASLHVTRSGCIRWGFAIVDGGTAESGDYTLLRTRQSNWCPTAGNTGNYSNILRANQDSDAEDETLFMTATNHGSFVGETRMVTILDDDAPTAPTGFTVTAGDTGALLAWTDPSNANITRWEYQQKAGSGAWGNWTRIPSSGAATTSHNLRRLTNGTEYTFKLRAVNRNGNGAASAEQSATPASAAPAAPTNLSARPGMGEVTLTWDWAARAGRSSVGQWNDLTWQLSQNGGNWGNISPEAYDQKVITVKVRHTVTGLTNGTAYTFKVRASNSSGTGGESNVASATPASTLKPGKPTLTAESNVPGGVTLTGRVDPSYTVTGWEVQRDGGSWTAVNEPQRPPQLLVTFLRGLTWDTAYTFKVRALNGTATGAESDAVSVTTKGKNDAVPEALEGLSGSASIFGGAGVVWLDWVKPKATVTEYQLLQNGVLQSEALTTTAVTRSFPGGKTVAGLQTTLVRTRGESYTFNVRGKNANGIGGWSNALSVTVPVGDEAPGKPWLRVVEYDQTVRLDFGVAWYPDRMREVTGWEYSQSPKTNTSDPDWNTMTLPGFSDLDAGAKAQHPPGILVTGLTNGTEYTFKVRATVRASNGIGPAGAESDGVTATPSGQSCWDPDADGTPTCTDRAVPSAPVLTATPGNGQITLNWADGVTGFPFKWQYFWDSGFNFSGWTDVPNSNINTRSHVVTGLVNGRKHAVQVRGVNSTGDGAASNTIRNVTPSTSAGAGGQGGAGGAGGAGGEGGGTDGTSTDGSGTPVPALPLAALGLLAAGLLAGGARALRRRH